MRDYARVLPQFWRGETGKSLRSDPEEQVLALYLMTCPSSTMTGLYYLPIPTIAHETGLGVDGVSSAMQRLSDAGFAHYDNDEEVVWVPEMARCQIDETLPARDNRIKGVLRELEQYRGSRFHAAFVERYAEDFHLPLRRAFKGPSKALRSQDQDQDQEQEQEQEQEQDKDNVASASPSRPAGDLFADELEREGDGDADPPALAPPSLPFKPDDALRAIGDASSGRFVATKLNRGQAINAQRIIRAHPDIADWQLVGEWLGAGGEAWKTELDARSLANFEAWLGHATKWRDDGKPVIDRHGSRASPGRRDLTRGQVPVVEGLDFSRAGAER